MAVTGPLIRWGLVLPSIVVAFAVAYRLQQPLIASDEEDAATYCYNSIRSHDTSQAEAQCFTITNGLFTADSGMDMAIYFNVRTRIKDYIAANPGAGSKDNWVRGVGWDQTFFGRMPTAEDITRDPKLRRIYLMLDRIDVHCTWVSQPVLDLLPSELPEVVPGGEIVPDPGIGVFCDNVMDLVISIWPKPSRDFKARTVKTAMKRLNEVGLVQEAVKFARDDDRFAVQSVKLFADGALGSWGSAMLEPYSDHPWTSGIIPSIQPTHATSDMKYALDRLGRDRLSSSAYRMRSVLPARPILGSDFPVEPPNPFQGIYAAVTRRSPHTCRGTDESPDGWHTEQALSLDEAMWGFTGSPAYGGFLDGRAGVIREGALADWVVLDKPIESYDIESLRTLKVKETWVAGKQVYARPNDD
ncbi:amidohydrolase ytcJ [Fusarium beomiforme]|uniref:Amidohydrolase ytcJ n=1 Tax=Fusarium beomiforme TaxID=44412 RepID=A0A9P5AAC6_9HYPO|nr:amidohydrolase ytcJ [Fusarium beomiforme]